MHKNNVQKNKARKRIFTWFEVQILRPKSHSQISSNSLDSRYYKLLKPYTI